MGSSLMQFFTREVYEAMQDAGQEDVPEEGSGPRAARFERLWNALIDEYADHLAAIKPALPKSMQEFASVSLHDGKVTFAQLKQGRVAALELEGTGLWGPRVAEYAEVIESARASLKGSHARAVALPRIGVSRVTLTFAGVETVANLGEILGDSWLYHEVHLSDSDRFDYRVLLRESEFRVVAREVTFVDHGCGR